MLHGIHCTIKGVYNKLENPMPWRVQDTHNAFCHRQKSGVVCKVTELETWSF